MSHELNQDVKPNETVQIHQLFQRMSEEAIDLRVVEKFFSEIERRLLQHSSSMFEIDPIKNSLQQLKSFTEETPLAEVFQVEFNLKQEIQNWRNILSERDDKIETYHFRRFCDSGKEPLDAVVFSALARFYRRRPQTALSQSKFDLTITRLFTKERDVRQRKASLDRAGLINRLSELFDKWDDKPNHFNHSADKTMTAVEKIDEFIRETQSLADFEELVKNNLFDRFREFKRNLGENFFEPAIIAASIECNLAVGNAFQRLLGDANENLSSKLISTFDFAEAFHDTSPNAKLHTSEVLHEFKLHETGDGTSDSEELLHIWELLELVSSDHSIHQTASETAPAEVEESAKKSLPPQDRIADLLATLNESEPDIKLLRNYMQKSKMLTSIDLNDFLHSREEKSDRICREALSLILWSVEIQENELIDLKNLPLTIRDEVKTILRQSQNLAEQLGLLVEVSDQATQNRLLLVSNKLMETSFKLERAVVRFSNRNLGRAKPDDETPKVEKRPKPIYVPNPPQSAKPKANRWLMAATILVALLSGGLFFFNQQMNSSIPPAQKVEKIDISKLPRGEHLNTVYRQKSSLIVIAKSSWKGLSKDEQTETLQILLNYPSQPKLDTVIVNDEQGEFLADISPNGVNIGENAQVAEKQ